MPLPRPTPPLRCDGGDCATRCELWTFPPLRAQFGMMMDEGDKRELVMAVKYRILIVTNDDKVENIVKIS